jgi:hypothetical protein
MNKKVLLWVSLGIILVVAANELLWLGKSALAWVILALTVAAALVVVYLLSRESATRVRPLYVGLLVLAAVVVAVPLKLILTPDLSQSQVKAIAQRQLPAAYVVSAKYKGAGIWSVRFNFVGQGWRYQDFSEETGSLVLGTLTPAATPTPKLTPQPTATPTPTYSWRERLK